MDKSIRKAWLVLALMSLVVLGCKTDVVESTYAANEFTLMVAASNHGEVGPCG